MKKILLISCAFLALNASASEISENNILDGDYNFSDIENIEKEYEPSKLKTLKSIFSSGVKIDKNLIEKIKSKYLDLLFNELSRFKLKNNLIFSKFFDKKLTDLKNLDSILSKSLPCKNAVYAATISKDGKRILTGEDSLSRLINLENLIVHHRNFKNKKVQSVAISGNCKNAIVGLSDGVVILYDITNFENLIKIGEIELNCSQIDSILFSPDSQYALIGSGKQAVIGNLSNSVQQEITANCNNAFKAVCFTSDNNIITPATTEGTRSYTFLVGGSRGEREATRTETVYFRNRLIKWNISGLNSTTLFDLPQHHDNSINSIAIDPKENILIGTKDSTSVLLNKSLKYKGLIGSKKNIEKTALSNDGKYALLGSDDCSVTLWDLSNLDPKLISKIAHKKQITGLEFSPCSKFFLTSSLDKTIKLHNISALTINDINLKHLLLIVRLNKDLNFNKESEIKKYKEIFNSLTPEMQDKLTQFFGTKELNKYVINDISDLTYEYVGNNVFEDKQEEFKEEKRNNYSSSSSSSSSSK